MKVDTKQFVHGAKLTFKESMSDDLGGAAAELAYKTLLALFPFMIFLAALGGFISGGIGVENPTQEIMDEIGTSLPSDARSVLRGQLDAVLESKNGSLLSFGAILTLWSASAAMGTVMKALNRAYDVEESRPLVIRTALQVGLTLLASVAFVGTFTVLIVGQLFAEDVSEQFGLGISGTALSLLRLPVVFALLTVGMAVIYWAAPNVSIPFKWVTPGAFVFIIAWILFSIGFGFYVSNLGSYQSTYGTLGGVVVLMIFLYLSSYLMLIGAEINAVIEAKMDPESIEAPAGASEGGPIAARRDGVVSNGKHRSDEAEVPRMLVVAGAVAGIALALWQRGHARS